MIIGISGKAQSGKDTIGKIIQYLTSPEYKDGWSNYNNWLEAIDNKPLNSDWKIKKFADKLKDIVCLLIGCTREKLEDSDFKNTELGEEWNKYQLDSHWLNDDDVEFTTSEYFTSIEELNKKVFEWDMSNQTYTIQGLVKLTPRLLLQFLGTECGRNIIHPNIWVNALMSEYKNKSTLISEVNYLGDSRCGICKKPTKDVSYFLCDEHIEKSKNNYPNWIITDTRFPNELKAVKDRDGISIRVNRNWEIARRQQLGKELPDGAYEITPKLFTGKEGKINYIIELEKQFKEYKQEHPSETALDNAEFDYVIDNNSDIHSLIEKVRTILIKEKII